MIDSFCFADSEWMHRTDTAAVGCLGERMKRKRVPLALLQMFASLKITGGQGKVKKKLFCGNTVEVLQFLSVSGEQLHKHALLCSDAKRHSCPYFFMKSGIAAPPLAHTEDLLAWLCTTLRLPSLVYSTNTSAFHA